MQAIKRAPVLLAAALLIGAFGAPTGSAAADDPVVVGFIGSFASDTGKSTLRGAEIAIEELNAMGGVLGGREIKYVKADTAQDVTEGIKAYEYLAEVEEVDFIVSGSIDDVSLGWLPRMAEYRIPTLDTWTSFYGIIEKVRDEYDTYKMYFMNIGNDWALATMLVDFGKEMLAEEMGWQSAVILQEDTAYGGGVQELVMAVLEVESGIKVLDTIVYDYNATDFAPVFNKAVAMDPDFIYLISSVKSEVPSSQYVKLQVPKPMTGINVSAFGLEFWEDTGGQGAGTSTFTPMPAAGMDLDDVSAEFLKTYQAKYGDSRPRVPHFNGFNAYHGVKNAFAAAERAGGFEPLDDWVREMENTDVVLTRDGEFWHRYAYWKPGEVEPRTGIAWTHNIRFDVTPPFDEGGPPMVVIQWYEDGSVKVVYPPKYANGTFDVPSWLK